MDVSPRFHILLYTGLLVWGIFDLVSVAAGDGSLSKTVLGLLYLVIAGYQLSRRRISEAPVAAVQRVR